MPGATTASVVFLVNAIDWKLFAMPQTVPNSPTNGAVAPMVASELICRLSGSISRSRVRRHDLLDALQQHAPAAGAGPRRVPPLLHGRSEQHGHGVVRIAAEAAVQLVERRAGPERALERLRLAPAGGRSRNALSKITVQDQIEARTEEEENALDHRVGLRDQRPQAQARDLVASQLQRGDGLFFHGAILSVRHDREVAREAVNRARPTTWEVNVR